MKEALALSPSEQRFRIFSLQGFFLAFTSAFGAEIILSGVHHEVSGLSSVARSLVIFLSIYILHRFASASFRSYRPRFVDTITLSVLILISIAILWTGNIVAISVTSYFSKSTYLGGLSAESLLFMIPYATGALIIQAILGLHHGVVFSICFSLIVGLYTQGQALIVPYILSSCLVACLSLSRFRSRSAYTRAGAYLALLSLPFALGTIVTENITEASDITIRLLGALLSGVLSSSIAAGLTPIFEYFGGYVTDMRLIEIATLDHPLLKELSVQAPGTWNHSMVMGMMVESAASEIGANSVIARVGAYFHDIGKIKKPLYFAENQVMGENRHDKLSPSMSALIIRSHVKDGIELAKKHGIPKIIEDMIPQHHGTSLIEYFYDKACKDAKDSNGDAAEVDASLYTYPGPRPQTKEAGILMLADGIEAAARTISDPGPDRIQGLVQKMLNKVFASGELDECELTLKDLHAIAKCFTRVLAGIYHQRVAYAEPAEKVSEKTAIKSSEEKDLESGQSTQVASGGADKKHKGENQEKPSKDDSKEDLKRLGM